MNPNVEMKSSIETNSLAIDSKSLNRLKQAAKEDSPETIRAVAKQFESVLMNMMLKSMRDALPKEGAFDNEQTRMMTGMLDQQMSSHLSQRGLGLSEMLVKQLSKFNPQPQQQSQATSVEQSQMQNTAVTQATLAPAVNEVSGKIRSAYQQWQKLETTAQAVSPVLNEEDAKSARAWTIPELPPLLARAAQNVQPVTLPASQLSHTVHSIADKAQQFIQSMLPYAQTASASSGIPAKFMIGQAALESGWGKHVIKTADGSSSHNLFGIKADASWKGQVVTSYTTEYVDGVKQMRAEKFRAYSSYSEAFQDYAKLISQNPRYQQAMSNTHNIGAYATALQQAGYATDPQYSRKLTQVIQTMMS